jgi:aminopeptidase
VEFKDGRVVGCAAEEGQDVLEQIIGTDEGAHHLGECALVPKSSPIKQEGVLFLNTLFDENAACHLALGMGFPECLEGGRELASDELVARGVNQSATHVDFMIGTDDLAIDGIKSDGTVVPVFRDGTWVD